MEKQAFEPTGLIPRSIIRTVDRFVQQLLPGREKIALQEYRVSRYQILVSIKSLGTLVLIPILVSSTMKALFFTPLVEYFWNNNQNEIFLNQYQEKRAFSEMHDFSEKMFFEALLIEPKARTKTLEMEKHDQSDISNTLDFSRIKETLVAKPPALSPKRLSFAGWRSHQAKPCSRESFSWQQSHLPVMRTRANLGGKATCPSEPSGLPLNIPRMDFVQQDSKSLSTLKIFDSYKSKQFHVNETITNRKRVSFLRDSLSVDRHTSYKPAFLGCSQQSCKGVYTGNTKKKKENKHVWWSNNAGQKIRHNINDSPNLNESRSENEKYQTLFQKKTVELANSYNKQSCLAITNLLGDFLTFFTVSVLFRIMRPELIILKSFLTESVYSLSDTTKSFLLILGMDLLVGFHSPRGWELLLEGFLRHIGLPENENFILLFVALFPVFLDTVFKYWIFRYLNKISPSTVVTYHSMIE